MEIYDSGKFIKEIVERSQVNIKRWRREYL